MIDDVVRRNLDAQKAEEKNLFRELRKAYRDTERVLMEEAEKTINDINKNPNKVNELRRLEDLTEQVRREMHRYADETIRPTVATGMVQSSYLGSEQARQALRDIYGDVATGVVLPIPAIDAFTRHLSTGPLGRLFDSFGDDASAKARATMLKSIALGHNPRKTASELRKSLGTNKNRALLIARTETMRAHREGNRQYYQQSPYVDKWVWHAAPSSRTCAACWALHGAEFDLNVSMASHPACRCTMVPKPQTWREQGFNVEGDSYIESGESLFEKQPESTKQTVLGSKYKDYQQGNVKLNDFVAVKNSAYGQTYVKKVPA